MAWNSFPAGLFTAGAILTAAQMNTYMRDNLTQLRGDFMRFDLTTGNLTLNNTAWANLSTATDLTLAASAGDVVQVDLSSLIGSEATDLFLDAVTLVGGVVTNSFATAGAVLAAGQGIMGWRGSSGVFSSVGCSLFYKLVAGDVSGGNVVIRFRYKTGAAVNKTMYSESTIRTTFSARNHGPVEI